MEIDTIETITNRDQMLTDLSLKLAELVDNFVTELPMDTQIQIADLLKQGSELAVFCLLTPWPTFALYLQPPVKDAELIELARISPRSGTLPNGKKELAH